MKHLYKYLAFLLLPFLANCSDNENWTIVTEVQQGVYITGAATIYSGEAPASMLKSLDLDGTDVVYSELTGIYTWLKANEEFMISIVPTQDEIEKYGKGSVISESTSVEVASLVKDATPFTVSKDGFYFVIVNSTLKEINILPVNYGVIGAATTQGWNGETSFNAPTFDNNLTVTWSGKTNMTPGEYKFRYSGGWGMEINQSSSAKVKIFTDLGNLGSSVASLVENGMSQVKPGGANFTTAVGGEFEFTIEYNLRSKVFNATYNIIGDPVLPPDLELPASMFIIGSPYDWNWDNAQSLTPVNGFAGTTASPEANSSKFWFIKYFNAGDAVKFNMSKAWNGSEFGFSAVREDSKTLAGITDDGGNIKIGNAGWYIVLVTTTRSEDEKSYVHNVDFLAPDVYVIGNTVGTWDAPNTFKFTVPSDSPGEFVSPAFTAADNLRLCIKLDGIDWWRTEFNIFDNKIEYRGNGGDQAGVAVSVGQKAYLKFSDGTGRIQ